MRHKVALIGVPVLLLATACGGDGGDVSDADPQELVEQAGQTFADADTVAFTLTSKGVPDDQNGVSAAEGSGVIDADEPRFAGQITGRIQGMSASIDVIAIGEQTWVKLFTPTYQPMDLADMGAPNPAMFFHPETGLPALLDSTDDLSVGSQTRQGADILTEVVGTIDAAPVYELLRLGSSEGEYDVTFGITDSGELRTIRLTGEFYGSDESTYDFVVTDYGEPVDITEP